MRFINNFCLYSMTVKRNQYKWLNINYLTTDQKLHKTAPWMLVTVLVWKIDIIFLQLFLIFRLFIRRWWILKFACFNSQYSMHIVGVKHTALNKMATILFEFIMSTLMAPLLSLSFPASVNQGLLPDDWKKANSNISQKRPQGITAQFC